MKYGLAFTGRASNLQRTGLAMPIDRHLRPSNRSRMRINNLNAEIDVGICGQRPRNKRRRNREEKYQQKTRLTHPILLCTRKGFRRWFTPVSWLCESGCELSLE